MIVESIWKDVIDIKYGRNGYWAPKLVKSPNYVGVWKQIVSLGGGGGS